MSTGWPYLSLLLSMGELLEEMEWSLIGDVYMCPSCVRPFDLGHAEDCGLREILDEFQDKAPDEVREV